MSYKSGFISKIRDDVAELDTEEGIVIVGWMAICKVVRIGDFVEVTGGLHKAQKGWVDEVHLGYAVNIIRMDESKPTSEHVEVRPY
jgi:hydrogenase maturation factor